MREKGQLNRFNSSEYGLMRSLFLNNDDLLYGIRKTLIQIKPNKTEQEMISKSFSNPAVAALIRKWILPDLDGDSPLFQLVDLQNTLSEGIKGGKLPDQMLLEIKAKTVEIDYLAQQLDILCGATKEAKTDISLKKLADLKAKHDDPEQVLINIMARNWILSYVDSNINQIITLANSKAETMEEAKARLAKNSNK